MLQPTPPHPLTCCVFHCTTRYQAEGLDDSVIPSYRNNTPCCNLIEKKSPNFVGILPLLDDQSASDKNTDEKFCAKLIASFGRAPGPYAKAPTDALRKASGYFFGRKGAGTKYFCIVHFAGEVKCVAPPSFACLTIAGTDCHTPAPCIFVALTLRRKHAQY